MLHFHEKSFREKKELKFNIIKNLASNHFHDKKKLFLNVILKLLERDLLPKIVPSHLKNLCFQDFSFPRNVKIAFSLLLLCTKWYIYAAIRY